MQTDKQSQDIRKQTAMALDALDSNLAGICLKKGYFISCSKNKGKIFVYIDLTNSLTLDPLKHNQIKNNLIRKFAKNIGKEYYC